MKELITALCAEKLVINSDKGVIEGHPMDLCKKYGFDPFCKALLKYLELKKVEIIMKVE